MKESVKKLLDGNLRWADFKTEDDPDFFKKSALGQSPKFLWIGCSDSRVSPNDITETDVGELFIHRNIANLVVHNDLNLLSVLQYAVEVLKVEDIIVCGHYGCGGVNAALKNQKLGLIDQWLEHIKEAYDYYQWEMADMTELEERSNRLVELNVLEQINNLGKTEIIQKAWKAGMRPSLNGWVYDIETGKIKILHEEITSNAELAIACKYERKKAYEMAKN